MDLTKELEFQQQQLLMEERELAEAQRRAALLQQQVIARRGAIAEVQRLMELQAKEEGEDAEVVPAP